MIFNLLPFPFTLPLAPLTFLLLLFFLLPLPSPVLSAPFPFPFPFPPPSTHTHSQLHPIDYTTLRCPPSTSTSASTSPSPSVLPTPTYGTSGAAFLVCAEVSVSAPPPRVYAALLDFASYGLWNRFVVSVDAPSGGGAYVGMRMTLTTSGVAGPGLNTTSSEVVTVLSGAPSTSTSSSSSSAGGQGDAPPYLLAAWRYDDGLGGLGTRAEHPTVLASLDGGAATRVLSYETYYEGLFTGTVALLRGTLQERFETQALDLKAYVESMG